jgi:serine/threonine-protein kinase
MGTPHYISPEQVLGAKVIDHRADIYSLGASLYCLATGKVPFEGSSGAHIMSRHLNDPLPDPREHVPELSEEFCRVVAKAMEKDPARRHQDTEELRAALARVRAEAGGAADHVAGAATVVQSRSSFVTEFGEADRQAIETSLARAIGPVAKLLVERQSKRAASRSALLQSLATQITSERDRRRFLRECGAETGNDTGHLGSGSRPVPTQASASLDQEVLDAITRQLTEHLGPVARVLVKREAAKGGEVDELSARLADHIRDDDARRGFLAAVARLD